ncbi:aldehyde dehydrogenase [Naviculisporaceae sp. PSN 640]
MSDLQIRLSAPNAIRIAIPTGLFINNEFVKGRSEERLICTDPANEEYICSVEMATASDVDDAIRAARAAYDHPSWGGLTSEDRSKLLLSMADVVEKNMRQLYSVQCLELGRPYDCALHGEGPYLVQLLRSYASWAEKLDIRRLDSINSLADKDPTRRVFQQPVGVCYVIAPWDYLLIDAVEDLGAALATGNCVILQPSEDAPLSALYLAKLFKEAGYPPGVVQVLIGYAKPYGKNLSAHSGIDKIVNTKICTKSPTIIFDDADMMRAPLWALYGGFGRAGQLCTTNTRILVHERVEGRFLELVNFFVKGWKNHIGDPFDPLVQPGQQAPQASKRHLDRVLSDIEAAKKSGAKLVFGGGRLKGVKGYYIEPTIFSGVTSDMKEFEKIAGSGPILAITTFKTEDEAIAIANKLAYSSTAMIFTESPAVARRTASKLRAKFVYVNEVNDIKFGNLEGQGRGGGHSADEELSKSRGVHLECLFAEPAAMEKK